MDLEAVLAASIDGVLAFDSDYRYTAWSAAMERISGLAAGDVIGKQAFDVFPFLLATGEDRAFHAALAGEPTITRGIRFEIASTGRHGFFDGHYHPLRDADGRVVGGIGVIREVTDRVLLEHHRSWLGGEVSSETSSERLALALEAAQLGPWQWDASTDIVTYSERLAEIFGLPAGETRSWAQMRELVHPDDRDAARGAVEDALANHERYQLVYRVVRDDGVRWVLACGRGLYGDDGRPRGMLGIVQDITASKQAEQALVEEKRTLDILNRTGKLLAGELELERLLQALTDAATELSDAQFGSFFYNVVDDQGGSYMLYTLSGVSRDAFAKFPMPRNTAVFAPTFAGQATVRSDDITRDPRYGQSDPHRGMPAGHLPVRSYLAVPVISRSGVVHGGLFFGHAEAGVFTARHERILEGIAGQAAIALDNAHLYRTARAAEHTARERADALAEAHRRKDDFLAMLAHELRNPLGATSNAIQVLARTQPDHASFRRALDTAERQIAHQRKLVDDLLDVSRIPRGKLQLELEALDLATVVRQAAEDYRASVVEAGLALDVEVGDAPIWIQGDAVRLAQALGNVLDNARKFTPAGGRIGVTVETTADEARVRVTDTGAGIDAAVLPELFAPFVQGRRRLEHGLAGLGLGLALVKGFVELHPGGRVEVTSAGAGQGSEVHLALRRSAAQGQTVNVKPVPAIAGRHILIVEDMIDAAETLRDLLEMLGCRVEVAYDAEQGLERLEGELPDLVLCDLGLPGPMNGLDLARAVRASGRPTRMIALSGFGTIEDQHASEDAGFDLHLTKPVQFDRLVEIIARLDR